MSRGSLLFAAHIALLLLLLLLPPSFCFQTSTVEDITLCGNINIKYPFQLNRDLQNCGYYYFDLYCEENVTVICLYSGRYYVKAINYSDWTIRVVDAGVQKKDNYFSNPLYSLTSYNLSGYGDPFSSVFYNSDKDIQELRLYSLAIREVPIIFISCANPMHSPRLVDTAPCINNSANSSLSSTLRMFSYVMIGNISSFDLGESCRITQMVVVSPSTSTDLHRNLSCEGIYNEIASGFELSWFNAACDLCSMDKENCTLDNVSKTKCPAITNKARVNIFVLDPPDDKRAIVLLLDTGNK
ncbi:unnamed protein product [Prunus armeniaca]